MQAKSCQFLWNKSFIPSSQSKDSSSDQFTVIAGPSGCIVVDKGSWQSECESTEEHEEDGQVVTVTQTITAPTPGMFILPPLEASRS